MVTSACNSFYKEEGTQEVFFKGSYGYDHNFLKKNGLTVVELFSEDSSRSVMLVPDWQGRVMTSSSAGLKGRSYGWINYDLISSKKQDDQFNPYGGEERFWLGPEGGPFSLYFQEGDEQLYPNWKVPGFIDTEPFKIQSSEKEAVVFTGNTTLYNAAGNPLDIEVLRKVKLLGEKEIAAELNMSLPKGLEYVAYQSENVIKNSGKNEWTADYGFVSIWMLCMFNPSPSGIVVIPVNTENLERKEILTDDYFGIVAEDRLKLKDGIVYFRVDGKKRSKIGISPVAARSIAAGYDPVNQKLTVVTYSGPKPLKPYVNSAWGEQEDPLKGDVINAYNDGPVDGKVMGPFYEIETSSPAALLKPGEETSHKQSVYHFSGSESTLKEIGLKLFELDITEISNVFDEER